jgi:lipoprotein-releasing system ATP-binding protein
MSDAELDAYRSQSIGFVFQFYHLLPELSVIENVLLGAMIKHGRLGYAKNSKSLKERAAALLADVGLSHRLTHRPAELSGGERQRVAIARSLMNEPPVLLADEPTGNLDQKTGGEILEMLLDIRRKKNLTLVVVTHDLATARRADRSVHLVDGLLAAEPANERGNKSSSP